MRPASQSGLRCVWHLAVVPAISGREREHAHRPGDIHNIDRRAQERPTLTVSWWETTELGGHSVEIIFTQPRASCSPASWQRLWTEVNVRREDTQANTRPILSKMSEQASNTDYTDNHVKRVSCRNSNTFLHCFTVICLLCMGFMPSNTSAGDISCQGIRYKYFQKGLDSSDIPAAPQQGKWQIILSSGSEILFLVQIFSSNPSVMWWVITRPKKSQRHFVIFSSIILKDFFRKYFCVVWYFYFLSHDQGGCNL